MMFYIYLMWICLSNDTIFLTIFEWTNKFPPSLCIYVVIAFLRFIYLIGRGPQRAATGTGTDGRGHYIRRMYIVKKVPAKPVPPMPPPPIPPPPWCTFWVPYIQQNLTNSINICFNLIYNANFKSVKYYHVTFKYYQ